MLILRSIRKEFEMLVSSSGAQNADPAKYQKRI
jgi:hypothetical protein